MKKNIIYIILGILVIILVGAGCGEKTEIQSEQQEKTQPEQQVYSVNQEVKVGKSIWKVLGVIEEGRALKLPSGSELGKIYYKEPADSKLMGVVLDFVNFDKIPPLDFEGNELETVLIDGKNREFEPLSYDKATSIISAEEERKLDDYFNLTGTTAVITFLYIVPKNSTGFKVKVRDETKYSNEEVLIDLGL